MKSHTSLKYGTAFALIGTVVHDVAYDQGTLVEVKLHNGRPFGVMRLRCGTLRARPLTRLFPGRK